jgi:16S rRNA (adenine1518-N6/adenine1519-N6)-dimethyltransferase
VPVGDEERFHRLVKAAFSQRRKTLANALAGGLGVSVATARQWLAAAGIDPGRRAETLSLEEFSRLNSFGPLNPDGKMKGFVTIGVWPA